jgi:hypothetical protein
MIEMERLHEPELEVYPLSYTMLAEAVSLPGEEAKVYPPSYQDLYVAAHEATRQTYQHDAGNIQETVKEKQARRFSGRIGAAVGAVAMIPPTICIGLSVEGVETPPTWRQALAPVAGVLLGAVAVKVGRKAADVTYESDMRAYQQHRTEYLEYAQIKEDALTQLSEHKLTMSEILQMFGKTAYLKVNEGLEDDIFDPAPV